MSDRPRKHFDIRIEPLAERHVEEAAKIHAICFPDKGETLLGHECIRDVYHERFLGPRRDTFCLVAVHVPDGRVAAYLYGSEPRPNPDMPHAFINKRVFRRHALRQLYRPKVWAFMLGALRRRLNAQYNEGASKPVPEWASVSKMLGIHPDFRGGNVGVDLMLAIEPESRKRGARRLMGLVEKNNIKAERMYASIGWVRSSPPEESAKYQVFAMHKDI